MRTFTRKLRENLAQLQGQLEGVRAALAEGQASKHICRREDFVPTAWTSLQESIEARQADLHDAMLSGRPDEVAGISTWAMQHNSGSEKWDDAIDGDEHSELRSIYGLRGVRVDPDDNPPVRSGRCSSVK